MSPCPFLAPPALLQAEYKVRWEHLKAPSYHAALCKAGVSMPEAKPVLPGSSLGPQASWPPLPCFLILYFPSPNPSSIRVQGVATVGEGWGRSCEPPSICKRPQCLMYVEGKKEERDRGTSAWVRGYGQGQVSVASAAQSPGPRSCGSL